MVYCAGARFIASLFIAQRFMAKRFMAKRFIDDKNKLSTTFARFYLDIPNICSNFAA